MNILFLVSSFLLIFVFLNASILKNSFFFYSEKNNFCNYLITKQNLENRLEQHKYHVYKQKLSNSSKTPPIRKKILPKDDQPNIPGISHRFNKNPHSLSKWNLAPLILKEKSPSYLQKSTVLLLKDLYGHTSFWKEAEKTIPNPGEALLASFKEKKGPLNQLSDMFPEDPHLQMLFYKMLKGSGSYSLSKKTGYPPLEDFFHLDSKNDKTIELFFASYPVLKALLGEEFTQAILDLEKEKAKEKTNGYPSISGDEFRSLLPTLGPEISIQDLNSMVSSISRKVSTEKLVSDGPQGISLKMPIVKINVGNEEHKKKK